MGTDVLALSSGPGQASVPPDPPPACLPYGPLLFPNLSYQLSSERGCFSFHSFCIFPFLLTNILFVNLILVFI